MEKTLRISASVLKILVGMLFVFSAVSKFVSIDVFEIYVYSFGLFSLTTCFYLSRLLIAVELIIGTALISHRYHRFTVVATLLFLVCFIVFLVYAQLIGRTDSCHCFGELMPFNPIQSIVKNAVLVLVLLFVMKYTSEEWYPRWWLVVVVYVITAALLTVYMIFSLHILDRLALVMMLVMMSVGVLASFKFYKRWYVTTALVLIPIVTVFVQTPPDNWFYKSNSEYFDSQLLLEQIDGVEEDEAMQEEEELTESEDVDRLSDAGLDNGKHVVAFFSPACGYCRLAADKISTIVKRTGASHDNIVYIFPKVADETKYEAFYEKSHSMRFREMRIDKDLFLKITRGSFPLVLLMKDGAIETTYSYRNIDEEEIGEWIKN